MVRDKLLAYWPIILLCVGAAALPVHVGFANLLHSQSNSGSPPNAYPIRIQLSPVQGAVGSGTTVALPSAQDAAAKPADFDSSMATETTQIETTGTVASALEQRSGDMNSSSSPNRLLAINFNLSDPLAISDDRDGNAVFEATKNIRLNGADAGRTTIRVTSGSALFIARNELSDLLEAAGRKDLSAGLAEIGSPGRFVSFDEMRKLGLGVRYDPVSDRILVST